MKRFYFTILAIMAMATAFASELEPFDCEITVANIKAYSAEVTITPNDESVYYIYSCCTKEKFDELGETGIKDYFKEQMDYYIEYYEENGEELTYAEMAYVGTVSKTFNSLSPETDYVVFAYSINTFNASSTSSLQMVAFTTPKDSEDVSEEVDMHIVNPKWKNMVSSSGGWWQISGYTENASHWVTLSNINTTKVSGTYYEEDLDMDYTKLYYYDANGAANPVVCKYVEVTINLDENGVVTAKAEYITQNGVWYHITFDEVETETDRVEGISENDGSASPAASAEGRKYVRNNRLVIEKNGKTFNVVGQVIK